MVGTVTARAFIALLIIVAIGGAPADAATRQRHAAAASAAPSYSCPTSPSAQPGQSFKGQTVQYRNFAYADLTNADFSGATLSAVMFVGANLTGANFSGARFVDAIGNPVAAPYLMVDFSFANLTAACFIGATFESQAAPTYFTRATLSCADFSSTDIGNGRVLFGPDPLVFDAAACRPRFRSTHMNCEFPKQWGQLEMDVADVTACAGKLANVDFSGARFAGANLSGMDISGATWSGANLRGTNFQNSTLDKAKGMSGAAQTDLSGALFNAASARFVDFSNGKLFGAVFQNAELEGANFANASLIDDPPNSITSAAVFDGAHLRNASFVGAQLNSVSFVFASLYGTAIGVPPAACNSPAEGCGAYPATGATCSCATLRGANLTRTDFSNAFLYGVDASTGDTIINGTIFNGAILVGANFTDATFQVDSSQGGAAPTFRDAWLHGARLPDANLSRTTLSGAIVDFGVNNADGTSRTSNALRLLLSRDYTGFRNWSGAATPCVRLRYNDASTLPGNIGDMTCPDGRTYPGAGCGAAKPRDPNVPTNPAWFGGNAKTRLPVSGWYDYDSTYETATTDPAQICGGTALEPAWFRPTSP